MNSQPHRIGIRWTVGDVSDYGLEALRLSILSAFKLFPEGTRFAVCVNSISIEEARRRTGEVPSFIKWLDANQLIPEWLNEYVDAHMAQGVAWKLAPVRLFPGDHEISLDNDVILWRIPDVMHQWLEGDSDDVLMAEDLHRALGQFSSVRDPRPINSGIRGLPPFFKYEQRLQAMLRRTGIKLRSELDEQGLQAATLCESNLMLVPTRDVTICSAFPMHQHHLGRCGAHFVGLNPKTLPWTAADGRPMHEAIRQAWRNHSQVIADIVFSGIEREPVPDREQAWPHLPVSNSLRPESHVPATSADGNSIDLPHTKKARSRERASFSH
jgi:hypothetical protein